MVDIGVSPNGSQFSAGVVRACTMCFVSIINPPPHPTPFQATHTTPVFVLSSGGVGWVGGGIYHSTCVQNVIFRLMCIMCAFRALPMSS